LSFGHACAHKWEEADSPTPFSPPVFRGYNETAEQRAKREEYEAWAYPKTLSGRARKLAMERAQKLGQNIYTVEIADVLAVLDEYQQQVESRISSATDPRNFSPDGGSPGR